ncbi:hypothetical protein P886_3555 [Alteromonadaceae bacterium 2753L.S.0a.02]|nr:hypothetical protein P886_3555 [Alteromonadaceae bacterium 2753L.S.0a.02]
MIHNYFVSRGKHVLGSANYLSDDAVTSAAGGDFVGKTKIMGSASDLLHTLGYEN